MRHPQPEGFGKNLTEPDFVNTFNGHLGINVETDPDRAADLEWRANARKGTAV